MTFVCQNCGAQHGSWSGRCHVCGEWNTIVQQVQQTTSSGATGHSLTAHSIGKNTSKGTGRLKTGIQEADVVLGGGLVPGSLTLVAGQPGIGKSTILLQVADFVAKNEPVLYVSGEESADQINLRARRLKATSSKLQIANSSSADDIAQTILNGKYKLVMVDSIQTMTVDQVGSAAGTVSQITNSTQLLQAAAKQTATAVVVVGHVTKEGSIAGPKVLEHVVDVVLQLEGDRYGGFKLLRGVKNRYGSTNEIGIFEMTDTGMQPVNNPSAVLLSERQITDGSVVLATMEGTRPLLVEVQALVNRTNYGYPKRTASGVDINRVNLLIAVLERRTKLNLTDQDIYVNVVGGIRVQEPAADLAICMAIASASKGMQLKQNVCVFGEVGLSGELRHVPFAEKRVGEARKLGFDGALGPLGGKNTKKISGLFGGRALRDALNQFLEKE